MVKRRIIPVILYKDGHIVQSKYFSRHQLIGDPFKTVNRYSDWYSDELIYLDISRNTNLKINSRNDTNSLKFNGLKELVKNIAENNFCPITIGGGIHDEETAISLFELGADKISFCSAIIDNNESLIRAIAKRYGSQSLVAIVDIYRNNEDYFVFDYRSGECTNISLNEILKRVQKMNFGEIVVQDVKNDGKKHGFDLELFKIAAKISRLPLIALGGAGAVEDFHEILEVTDVSGVAASNFFQHTELSVKKVHSELIDKYHRIDIRKLIF